MAITTQRTTTPKTTTPKTRTGRLPRLRRYAPAPAAEPRLHLERTQIRDLKLTSVARVSACFYLCGLVVVLVAAMVLWIVASALGIVAEIERFMGDLGFEGFRFISGALLWASLLIGLALSVILTVVTVVAAALYNLFADLVGGLEVTLTPVDDEVDDEPAVAAPKPNGNGRGNGSGVSQH